MSFTKGCTQWVLLWLWINWIILYKSLCSFVHSLRGLVGLQKPNSSQYVPNSVVTEQSSDKRLDIHFLRNLLMYCMETVTETHIPGVFKGHLNSTCTINTIHLKGCVNVWSLNPLDWKLLLKTHFTVSKSLPPILTCVCHRSRQNWWWNRASSSQSGTWTELPGGGRSSWAPETQRTGRKGRWLKRRTPLLGSCGLSAWHWMREGNQRGYVSWQRTTNNKSLETDVR